MPKKHQGKPETADGYSVVANEYLEALYNDPNLKLPTRIRIYIQRWTWGFNKKEARLSQARMAKDLKVDRRYLQRVLLQLEKAKLIHAHSKCAGSKTTYGINKYYRQWKTIEQPAYLECAGRVRTESAQVGGSVPLYVKKEVCKERVKPAPPKPKPKPRPKKKKFVPPELGDVQAYFTSNGYTMESAQKFFNYYAAGEWHDGNGKPVKNWKQKAIAVWFKPENTDRVISERQPTKFITRENEHELME